MKNSSFVIVSPCSFETRTALTLDAPVSQSSGTSIFTTNSPVSPGLITESLSPETSANVTLFNSKTG